MAETSNKLSAKVWTGRNTSGTTSLLDDARVVKTISFCVGASGNRAAPFKLET